MRPTVAGERAFDCEAHIQHSCGQRTSGIASNGEHYALHYAPTQTQGQPGEERRSSTGAKEVSRIQLHRRTRTSEADRPRAIARFKERIREQTRRTRGISLALMVKQIATYLRGWLGYFGDCQTPSVLQRHEAWLRRRLRSLVWKQWKRGRTRFRELRKRGVGQDLAAQTAGSPHGPWRIANSPALAIALPNAYFAGHGLPSMIVSS
ncbi:MAG: hypothetical protein DMG97_19445 [Acidobacteria bacterium]|nr:MAG: hypothetical protein DMG97_19445 [Acidobacteriota bacterium]